jgi:PAS domain S-box-containing protein
VTTPDPADVIDSLAVGFVAVDPTWKITRVNASASRILGRPANDLVGHDAWTQFPGTRDLHFGQVFETVMATRRADSVEAYYPGLDVWVEIRVEPAARGIVVYFLDVTQRRLAEQRANATTERAELVGAVTEALISSLDVPDNLGSVARLVVPYLGEWAVVSVVDGAGAIADVGSWHVDPARRAEVEDYRSVRLSAFADESLAAQTVRTGQVLVLEDDAASVIAARMQPGPARDLIRALEPAVCVALPMTVAGRTVGLLSVYGTTPWTSEQRQVADDIVARAALALDNSLAYARAQAAREAAEKSEKRLTLLAQVSEALSGTEHTEEAVGRLARLVVPQLGDWSFVTIIDEDGNLRDVGLAHRDPERQADLEAYSAVHLQEMTYESAVATGLRTGQHVIVPQLRDDILARFLPDPSVARLTKRLDPHGIAVFPLTARARTFGVLVCATTTPRGGHTADEIATGLEVARRAGPVLDSARAAERARNLAESMQRSLLTVSSPGAGLAVATHYRPAYVDREIGGDWYDVFTLPDGSTVVTIGDVMGHDMAAIAAMAQVRTFMRANAWTLQHSPDQVLAATDRVSRGLGPRTFATAVTAELQPAGPDGSVLMRWANAGHPPPAVLTASGEVTLLDAHAPDLPLGIVDDAPRHGRETVLAAGSTVVFYTDGLIERRDREIDMGLRELERVLARLAAHDPESLLDALIADLIGHSSHNDDTALLAVRVAGRSG